ncbi:retinol-binding protein pinta-like isoform X1 [Schistocerca cancellata]|uniref:retinol-binding protein pinta-like isoform X1 n=2 Tax=Schistocerca cancellata TaxID=274614 RepID=UPI002118B390|nr:retinol-binding protein pinta-like isoform X1 [Schistocerca cancellata]XP_049788432.1 retinol-binding protein pinta-like isoform X1 [Schistocerca cancellata]
MSDRYSFIPATREQVETIRKSLGTDEEDIKRTVASVRDWLRKQPHLPDEIEDDRIERMYINCKCNVERVKKGLDAYFSHKTRHPEIMMNRDPRGPDVVTTIEHVKVVTMPRLTDHLYRVHIFGDTDPDPVWVSWPNYGKVVSINLDMMLFNDYSLGDIVIVDLKNLTAGHALRTDINIIRAIEFGYKTAYCRSLKALHLINADKVIDFTMKILRSALSKKLQKRTHIHLPGSKTLFDHVAKEYLPDELGGTAGPIDKLAYEFIRRAEEKREWLLEQDRYTSDESKRPPDNHYADDMYGVAGSFKKLSVD